MINKHFLLLMIVVCLQGCTAYKCIEVFDEKGSAMPNAEISFYFQVMPFDKPILLDARNIYSVNKVMGVTDEHGKVCFNNYKKEQAIVANHTAFWEIKKLDKNAIYDDFNSIPKQVYIKKEQSLADRLLNFKK